MRNTKQASLLQALDSLEKDGFWPLRVYSVVHLCAYQMWYLYMLCIYIPGVTGGGGISLSKVVPIVYRDGNGT